MRDADQFEGAGSVEGEGVRLLGPWVQVYVDTQFIDRKGVELGLGAQGEANGISDPKGQVLGCEHVRSAAAGVLVLDSERYIALLTPFGHAGGRRRCGLELWGYDFHGFAEVREFQRQGKRHGRAGAGRLSSAKEQVGAVLYVELPDDDDAPWQVVFRSYQIHDL